MRGRRQERRYHLEKKQGLDVFKSQARGNTIAPARRNNSDINQHLVFIIPRHFAVFPHPLNISLDLKCPGALALSGSCEWPLKEWGGGVEVHLGEREVLRAL